MDALERFRLDQTWSSSAVKDGDQFVTGIARAQPDADFLAQRVGVFVLQMIHSGKCGKVAEVALVRTKGDMDICAANHIRRLAIPPQTRQHVYVISIYCTIVPIIVNSIFSFNSSSCSSRAFFAAALCLCMGLRQPVYAEPATNDDNAERQADVQAQSDKPKEPSIMEMWKAGTLKDYHFKLDQKPSAPVVPPQAPRTPSAPVESKPAKNAPDPSRTIEPGNVSTDLDSVLHALRRENSLIDFKSIGDLIMVLRRKVTDHPEDAAVRKRLGACLLMAGDYEGAAGELKHVVALSPRDYEAHTLLAQVLDNSGAHELAALEYRRAIALKPEAPEAHVQFGDSLMSIGDVSAAINEYRRALAVKPNAEALTGLAEALIVAHDHLGAVKAARQAVSLDPASASAHVALTKALILTGDQMASMRTARQAVLLSPSLPESHIALGRVLHAKGDLPGAVEEFKQAVSLDPLNALARNDLGFALYSAGDMMGAVSELRLALRLNPHLGEARNNLEIAIHGLSGVRRP